jgi:two-component system chemotaxis response regulator CheB
MKTQVLIVDDSEVYRLFLRQALATEPDIEVVSVASNGRLALPRVNHYKPEIVLLDYEMPELDGLATIPEIKKISPQSRILERIRAFTQRHESPPTPAAVIPRHSSHVLA